MAAPTRSIIKGKVATILNNRELAINRGAEQGVTVGMRFKVMESEVEVVDPETREQLGSIHREKIRVKVVDVDLKLCVARTYETYQVVSPAPIISYLTLGSRSSVATKVRTLRQGEPNDYSESQASVSIGDDIVEVEDDK